MTNAAKIATIFHSTTLLIREKYSVYIADTVLTPPLGGNSRIPRLAKTSRPAPATRTHLPQKNFSARNFCNMCSVWNFCRRSRVMDEAFNLHFHLPKSRISISSYKKTGGSKSPCIVNASHLGYGWRNTRYKPIGSLIIYSAEEKNQHLFATLRSIRFILLWIISTFP